MVTPALHQKRRYASFEWHCRIVTGMSASARLGTAINRSLYVTDLACFLVAGQFAGARPPAPFGGIDTTAGRTGTGDYLHFTPRRHLAGGGHCRRPCGQVRLKVLYSAEKIW